MATDLPHGYRPLDEEPFMNERQREYFRRKLVAWKEDILRESRETIQNLQHELLRTYDVVLVCDVDEIIAPDPRRSIRCRPNRCSR